LQKQTILPILGCLHAFNFGADRPEELFAKANDSSKVKVAARLPLLVRKKLFHVKHNSASTSA